MTARTVAEKAAWIVFCVAGLLARPLFADNAELGRKHASKAGQLAAKNKCKAAVLEFTKAYKLFKDPTILFNRAECYRRLGKDAEALKDYEQFLADMPTAPNRKNVEEHVASLKGSASVAPTTATAPAGPEAGAESAAKAAAPSAPASGTASAQETIKPGVPASASSTKKPASEDEPPEENVPVHHAQKWTD